MHITEDSFVKPFAMLRRYALVTPVSLPPPHQMHVFIRRQHLLTIRLISFHAHAVSTFDDYLHTLPQRLANNPRLMRVKADEYFLPRENDGNPFLYAIERYCLAQFCGYFNYLSKDYNGTPEEEVYEAVAHVAAELLAFRISSHDSTVIIHQRLAGFYGPPFTIPHDPLTHVWS
ncbi:hypothetical protein BDY19DRAFT_998491 [Irpex rosettiformis]|uniref:Uncharacterized protein n=1 Tax=Irpex rosettiformis TaxID=378272 RepID=A0ACB8TNH3_9APHY|nr:hypothetical protein BDY19DRAFT_998491 [Irpex rosettiformis]